VSQLYVMVDNQTQLLEVDELVKRIQSGALSDTVQVVTPGQSTWGPAKEHADVKPKLTPGASGSGVGPAPTASSPSGGASAGVPPTVASTSGSGGASAPAGTIKIGNLALPKGAVIGGGAAAGILLIAIIGWVIFRNSYSRGAVLDHVPADCAQFVYVDVEGIATSEPVKSNLEKLIKNARDLSEDKVEKKSKKDKERMTKAIDALKSNGLDETSVREFAMCVPTSSDDDKGKASADWEKSVVLIGGTFRRGNVLKAIKEGLEAGLGKDDLCKFEDDDGLNMMKCSVDLGGDKRTNVYGALVEGRVLAISLDRKAIKAVRNSKNRAKDYSADKGEQVVVYQSKDVPNWDGSYGTTKLKVDSKEVTFSVETHYDTDKAKSKADSFKDDDFQKKAEERMKKAAKECFEKSPVDNLSDSVENGKVETFDDGVKYEYKAPNKEMTKAIKALADADEREIERITSLPWCVSRTVGGSSF
jgi:hypothetical protein